jgi:hypothetical protein
MPNRQWMPLDEVQRACRELGLRDWTRLAERQVLPEEARRLLDWLGAEADLEDFRLGLETELKHGRFAGPYNVTNNHPVLTAQLALATLRENPTYYRQTIVQQVEQGLDAAIRSGDAHQIDELYEELVNAHKQLCQNKSAFE